MKHLHEYINENYVTEQLISEGFWSRLFGWLFRPFTKKEKSSDDFNDISIDDIQQPLDKQSAKVRTAQLQDTLRKFVKTFQNGFRDFDFLTIEHKPSIFQDVAWNHKVTDPWYEYILWKHTSRKDIEDQISRDDEEKFQFINIDGKGISVHMYALVEERNRVLQYEEGTSHPIHLYDVKEYRLNNPEDAERLKNTVKEHPDWKRVQFGRLVQEKLDAIK